MGELDEFQTADLIDYQSTRLFFPGDSRPDWDSWFMTLAFIVSQRSLDGHTKHGCIVVDESRAILSVGYNSPPRGCMDEKIPLDRPAKYLFMEHSESNAIVNAARCGVALKGSVFYVTGPPCHACFRKIINVGATRIVQGPILHRRTKDQEKAIEAMNMRRGPNFSCDTTNLITIDEFPDLSPVLAMLTNTSTYINCKLQEQRNEDEKQNTPTDSGQPPFENSGG